MNVYYTSFSSTSVKLPDRIQGVQYAIRKICKDIGYSWNSSIKNDIVFFEIGDLSSICISHKQIVKSLKLIENADRIILVVDDYFLGKSNQYEKFMKNINGFTFINSENIVIKTKMRNFIKRILDKEFDIIYNQYLNKHVDYFDSISKNQYIFDYSFANDYINLYIPNNERKIISSSYRDENNMNGTIICKGLKELECFKKICEYRICYMKNYGADLDYWVRNRFSQCYQANALIVGLNRCIFGDSYIIKPNNALKMNDKEFEEAVKKQKEDFLKNTKQYDTVKKELKEFLENV